MKTITEHTLETKKGTTYPILLQWSLNDWVDLSQVTRQHATYGSSLKRDFVECVDKFKKRMSNASQLKAWFSHSVTSGNRLDHYGYDQQPSIDWRGAECGEIEAQWAKNWNPEHPFHVYFNGGSVSDKFNQVLKEQIGQDLMKNHNFEGIREQLVRDALTKANNELANLVLKQKAQWKEAGELVGTDLFKLQPTTSKA
jgi:hypothetical protein